MTEFGKQFWEDAYSGPDRVWSGKPNVQLVAEASDLTPGTALDAGCGEGADALWLASRGWTVTAVDLAAAAIRRAGQHDAGDVEWVEADLLHWQPPRRYDLVTSQYVHLPERERYFRMLIDAVAPGGTLLVVGHDPSDPHTAHFADRGVHFTAFEVEQLLDGSWDVQVAESRAHTASHRHGDDVETIDTVLRALRRS